MSTNRIPPPSRQAQAPSRNGPPPVGAARRLPPAVGQTRLAGGAGRALPPAIGQARSRAPAPAAESGPPEAAHPGDETGPVSAADVIQDEGAEWDDQADEGAEW